MAVAFAAAARDAAMAATIVVWRRLLCIERRLGVFVRGARAALPDGRGIFRRGGHCSAILLQPLIGRVLLDIGLLAASLGARARLGAALFGRRALLVLRSFRA